MHATVKGTMRYRERFPDAHPDHWRRLGATDLTVSAHGFGGYRVHVDNPIHHDAMKRALEQGCNLVDTSSNYGDGGSEALAGKVLGEMDREEFVLVSKVGYVQGHNMRIAFEREARGDPFEDMVHYMEGCWHCIHPTFLGDQLQRSLDRLQMETIDVYLLHNPEYFLSDAHQEGVDIDGAREEYYRRLEGAFRWMETVVEAGMIRSYGVSSNTFPHLPDDDEFTSLERIMEIVEGISKDHHFTTVQLPMNLIERGAWTNQNQDNESQNVLEFAYEKDLAVLINRPLNALLQRQGMIRLSDFPSGDRKLLKKSIHDLAGQLQDLESRLAELAPDLPTGVRRGLEWGSVLLNQYRDLPSLDHWKQAVEQHVNPIYRDSREALKEMLDSRDPWRAWDAEYSTLFTRLLDQIARFHGARAQHRSDAIGTLLESQLSPLAGLDTLSQMATHTLASFPEITTVLVGMKSDSYVDDILDLISRARIEGVKSLLEQLESSGVLEKAAR